MNTSFIFRNMAEVEDDAKVHPSWNDYPELFAELDLSKNSGLTFRGKPIKAFELICGTNKKLDWKCSDCEHEWRAMGSHRVQGSGCPACANKVIHIDGRNSMAEAHPELAKEYQGDATIIVSGTNKKLDWKCSDCEHEWKAQGSHRVQGYGCPACVNQVVHIDGRNSMAKTHPDLAIEYQGDAAIIIVGTGNKLDWKCTTCEHEWKTGGAQRVNGAGCPACYGHLHSDGRNSMANTHPDLAMEYQGDAAKIVAGTYKKLDWKCTVCEHEWKAKGENRAFLGRGCPACVNQVVHIDGRNSLAKTHPDLAIEYQGDATKITAGTQKKLDWKCTVCEHEWKAVGSNRVNGSGCPVCAGQTVHIDGRNSMANTHPEFAIEYLGDATLIIAGTNKKLDWKCSNCECEWKTTGGRRIWGTGCPSCAKSGYDPSLVGYVYIHHYHDGINHWLKCGITNYPLDRISNLKWSAKKLNIEVAELEIYQFDDGFNARNCESELLSMKSLRFDSGYDVDGKAEFFKYQALEKIKIIISNWL